MQPSIQTLGADYANERSAWHRRERVGATTNVHGVRMEMENYIVRILIILISDSSKIQLNVISSSELLLWKLLFFPRPTMYLLLQQRHGRELHCRWDDEGTFAQMHAIRNDYETYSRHARRRPGVAALQLRFRLNYNVNGRRAATAIMLRTTIVERPDGVRKKVADKRQQMQNILRSTHIIVAARI